MAKLKRSHAASKRMTLSKKYKIEKKCKEFKKRQAKLSNRPGTKAGNKYHKSHKNPGIPNAWPEKEKLLRQLEFQRLREETEKAAEKERKRKEREERRRMEREWDEASEDELQQEPEEESESEDDTNSRLACLMEIKEVIDVADIVIEVLDARDPIGTRLLPLERSILAQGKKVMLVLDNADLVPAAVLEKWLVELNYEHPTFSLASDLAKSSDLYMIRNASVDLMLRIMDGYMTKSKAKHAPTVYVLAYKQVDAERVVDQLAGKFVHVAKWNETVKFMMDEMPDAKIRLMKMAANSLDAPEESIVQLLQTPQDERVEAVGRLLERVPKPSLMEHFQLGFFKTTEEFLEAFAKKHNSDATTDNLKPAKPTERSRAWYAKKGDKQKKTRVIEKDGKVNVGLAASLFLSALNTGTFKFHIPFDGKSNKKTKNSWATILALQECSSGNLKITEKQMKSIDQSQSENSLEISAVGLAIPDDAVFDVDAEIEAEEAEDEDEAAPTIEDMEEEEEEQEDEEEEEEEKPAPKATKSGGKKKRDQQQAQKSAKKPKKQAKASVADDDAYDFATDFK